MTEPVAVQFRAEIRQVKTMADFTANVILNIPEDCREQAKKLIDWLGDEADVVIVSSEAKANMENGLDGKKTGKGRKSQRG